jgi:hypothetical protein
MGSYLDNQGRLAVFGIIFCLFVVCFCGLEEYFQGGGSMRVKRYGGDVSIDVDADFFYDSDPDVSEETAENGDRVKIWRNCFGRIISIQVEKKNVG